MKLNKFRLLLASTAILSIMSAAQIPALAHAKTTVTIWVPWGGHDGDYYIQAAKDYSAANPDIDLQVSVVNGGGIAGDSAGKLATAVTGGDAPDAVLYWGAGDIPGLVKAGVIQALDDKAVAAAGITSDMMLTPQVWAAGQYDGKLYALPQLMYDRMFYWNKDLFKAAGLDPEKPPKTLAEVDAFAAKLSTKAADGSIDVLGFLPWAGQGGWDIWTSVFGGSYWDAKAGKINLQNPATLADLKWDATYVKTYGADALAQWTSSVGKLGQSSGGEPFVLGKLAMEMNGNWHISFIRQFAPKMNFGVEAIPTAPGGQPNSTVVGENIWLFPAGTSNGAAVLKFINWLYQPAKASDNADTLANISHTKAGAAGQKLAADPQFKLSIDVAAGPGAVFAPIVPNGNLIGNAIQPQIDAVHLGKATPEDALKQAQTDLDLAIKQGQ
jgi:ABC-type glycerol-3-phosphate transport system substrate-binding protein